MEDHRTEEFLSRKSRFQVRINDMVSSPLLLIFFMTWTTKGFWRWRSCIGKSHSVRCPSDPSCCLCRCRCSSWFEILRGKGQIWTRRCRNRAHNQCSGTFISFSSYKSNFLSLILNFFLFVKIRLADGSRLIGHFNHTNTVGQVRHYIIT